MVDCGIPSEVKHAQVSFNSTKVGSVAEYQCELGYTLSQHNHPRVCHSPGVWSDPPECNGEESCGAAEPWGTLPVGCGHGHGLVTLGHVLQSSPVCLQTDPSGDPSSVLMSLTLSLPCTNTCRDQRVPVPALSKRWSVQGPHC